MWGGLYLYRVFRLSLCFYIYIQIRHIARRKNPRGVGG